MKIPFTHLVLVSATALAALQAGGHDFVQAEVSAGQHAVATIKTSPVGQQIATIIHLVADKNMSGAEKASAVLVEAVPLIASFVADHGVSLIASIEDTGREVIQSLYNETIGAIAKATATAAAATS